jgi:predicted MFS family arabinose efflux permease
VVPGRCVGAQLYRFRHDDRVQFAPCQRAQLDAGLVALQRLRLSLTITRLFFGHVPDRLGGACVALGSVLIEAIGLVLIWLAAVQTIATVGAVLTGAGFALVYPRLGVEAVRRTPPESRGLAMGAYTAFLDVGLGFGSPTLGLIANWAGLSSVYLSGALLVLGAAIISIRLLYAPPREASPIAG